MIQYLLALTESNFRFVLLYANTYCSALDNYAPIEHSWTPYDKAATVHTVAIAIGVMVSLHVIMLLRVIAEQGSLAFVLTVIRTDVIMLVRATVEQGTPIKRELIMS